MKSTIWRAMLIPVAVLLLAGGVGAADKDADKDKWPEETFKMAPGGLLKLENDSGGSATITGWDKDQVVVEYGDDSNEPEDWQVDFDQHGTTLEIRSELRDRSIHSSSLNFEIKVPRRFDIEFESVGGGLKIEGVEGTFRGQTAGGGLTLVKVKGEARLKSGGGGINIKDSDLDGRVSTGGGKVLVENVIGNVKATSGGGEVRYVNVRGRDGDLQTPGHLKVEGMEKDTVVISNAGGGIRVKTAPSGAVVKTGGGDVRVTGADKFVNASTGGGDIEIELETGWITAKTGAGDIDAVLRSKGGDGDLELGTGYGEVTLIVPGDLGLDFDIDLRFTRNSDRDFEIKSDFKLDVEETEDWDREHGGTPIKHIYGTGQVNGGGRTVTIVTTNGNVRIVKK